jgi:hypothetical protein
MVLSKEVYEDIVRTSLQLNTGIDFNIRDATLQMGGQLVADASQRSIWKVTALRLDPCPVPALHYSKREAEGDPPGFKGCAPEVRVVAQPFFTPSWNGVLEVGDYAMHLFFRIDEKVAMDIAAGLRDLAVSLSGTCRANPALLSVHPCLIAEVMGPALDVSRRMFEQFSFGFRHLHRVAVMGTKSNGDPWVFF